MGVSCGECSLELTDAFSACTDCSKSFHLECVQMKQEDLKYLLDQGKPWKCPSCLKACRRLRSNSSGAKSASQKSIAKPSGQSSVAVASSSDQLGAILTEIRNLRFGQQKIVADIASIRESQSKLREDINSKYAELHEAVKVCTSTLTAHHRTLGEHEKQLDNVSDKITQIEKALSDLSSRDSGTVNRSGDQVLDMALEEIDERCKRRCNVMLFGVAEHSSNDPLQRKAHDEEVVAGLFRRVCDSVDLSDVKVTRVGARSNNKVRPIRAKMRNETDAHEIVANASKVRNTVEYKNIIIAVDKTPKQQAQFRELKRQLTERRKAGEKNLKIRHVAGVPKIVQVN